jgi:hypothetical protein
MAARVAVSGEATGGDGRRGVDRNGTGTMLTSWRSSGRAPRRCSGDDGEGPRRRRGLGFRARCGARGGGSGAQVGRPGGGGSLKKAWGGPLACGPRTGRRASLGLGGGGGVRGGAGGAGG